MNHKSREIVKLTAITILIITSLIQVGILWGYQNQGTPTSFLSPLFGWKPAPVSSETASKALFVPERLVISNGGEKHWLINSGSDAFQTLWEETRGYLKQIAAGNMIPSQPGPVGEANFWGDITTKKGFVFQFGYDIRPELLKWFLNTVGKVSMPDVSRLMVVPDSDDETSATLYIQDSQDRVYEYNILTRPETFQKIIDPLEADEKNNYRVYMSIRESGFEEDMAARPDILYVKSGPRYWSYYEVLGTIPQKALNKEHLAEILLGSEKGRYNNSTYPDGTIQLNNTENVYRLYTDGLLTYAYLPNSGASSKDARGNIGDALLKAYQFINSAGNLLNAKNNIYLTGVDDSHQGYYSFTFDYRINDMPVFTDLPSKNIETGSLKNAITIDSNDKQVIKCSWVLRDLVDESRKKYNDNVLKYGSVDLKSIKINDIVSGYVISAGFDKKLVPSIIISKMDGGGIMAVDMSEEKGE